MMKTGLRMNKLSKKLKIGKLIRLYFRTKSLIFRTRNCLMRFTTAMRITFTQSYTLRCNEKQTVLDLKISKQQISIVARLLIRLHRNAPSWVRTWVRMYPLSLRGIRYSNSSLIKRMKMTNNSNPKIIARILTRISCLRKNPQISLIFRLETRSWEKVSSRPKIKMCANSTYMDLHKMTSKTSTKFLNNNKMKYFKIMLYLQILQYHTSTQMMKMLDNLQSSRCKDIFKLPICKRPLNQLNLRICSVQILALNRILSLGLEKKKHLFYHRRRQGKYRKFHIKYSMLLNWVMIFTWIWLTGVTLISLQ